MKTFLVYMQQNKAKTLIVFVLLLNILFITKVNSFIAGYFNSKILINLNILVAIISAIGFFWLILLSYKTIKNRPNSISLRFISVIWVILLLSFLFKDPWWVRFCQGMSYKLDKISFEKDIGNIETWFNNVDKTNEIHETDLPEEIGRLSPDRALIYENINKDGFVLEISWGGGFIGKWGILILFDSQKYYFNEEDEYILNYSRKIKIFKEL